MYNTKQPQVVPKIKAPEAEQTGETEKMLRWRWVRHGRRLTKEYLVLWRDQPVDEMSWVPEANFLDPEALRQDLEEDKPEEAPTRR